MTGTTTSQALATRDTSPRGLVKEYGDSFAAVLPSHIVKPETWIRVAQGALKKGKRQADGRTDLEVAAANNPAAFLSALLDCARLGLEPGTEQFYLTPRKVKGRTEILGIVGYQGMIELIYRAGAVSSVVAEVVYANDAFVWVPGKLDDQQPPRWQGPQQRPYHEVDWDADDRGALRLAYAYAVMKDGATSKVIVLNRADITRIKSKSASASYDSSPWSTDPAAMWLKSTIRQLQKWVPTSSEYIREQLRAARDVAAEGEAPELPPMPGGYDPDERSVGDIIDTDQGSDDDVVEGEIVDG